jgi:hypothetical protein
MTLAEMMQKRKLRQPATANSAKIANDSELPTKPFAKFATFAVANADNPNATEFPRQVADEHDIVYPRWRILYRDKEPEEVVYCPPASYNEIMAWHPNAIGAERWALIRTQPIIPLSFEEEAIVQAWLAHIGESDLQTIAEVFDHCNTDADARRYHLKIAASANWNTQKRGMNEQYKPN